MQNKRVKRGRAMSFSGGISVGAALSILMTISGAAVLAKLVDTEVIPWESVGYGIMVILMLSSFTGSKIAVGRIKRRKMLVCMVMGLAYFCVLLSATALFFGGKYYGVGETMLLIFGGSGVAALSELNDGAGKRRKKRYTVA